jgi:transposase
MSKPKAPGVKYSQKVADLLVRAVENGATYDQAAASVNVDRSTLYLWLRKYDGLKERIEGAKETFIENQNAEAVGRLQELHSLANDYLLRLMRGQVTKTKTRYNGSGGIEFRDVEEIQPSDRLLERLAALEDSSQTFELRIGLAEPETESLPHEDD